VAPPALVVDAFLMRAANDAVDHGDGKHAMPRHENSSISSVVVI